MERNSYLNLLENGTNGHGVVITHSVHVANKGFIKEVILLVPNKKVRFQKHTHQKHLRQSENLKSKEKLYVQKGVFRL